MKKVVIDSKLYTIKNKEFEELERLLTVLQLALSDEDIILFFAYIIIAKILYSNMVKVNILMEFILLTVKKYRETIR